MGEKPSILFVDDEPNVLQALKRMLRTATEWHLEFAEGGEAALAILRSRNIDVVVTDMRMPGMDGAELLARVRDAWPGVTRIVLSGYCDHELVIRAIDAAHQYLIKPCSQDTLRRTITRAVALRKVIANLPVHSLLSKLNHVPTLPSLYLEIRSALSRADASARDVGAIVAKDVGFSGKLLQLVNSAFFGLPRAVTTPEDAVVLLGTDLVRALVLGTKVFSMMESASNPETIAALWRHSLSTGALARQIATRMALDRHGVDAAFLAGFVHDIGRLVIEADLPEQAARCRALARGGASDYAAEMKVFGTTHEAISAALLGTWGLPDAAVEAVAFIHTPSRAMTAEIGPLAAAHIAEVFDHQMQGDDPRAELDADYVERLGLTQRVEQWRAELLVSSPEPVAPG